MLFTSPEFSQSCLHSVSFKSAPFMCDHFIDWRVTVAAAGDSQFMTKYKF